MSNCLYNLSHFGGSWFAYNNEGVSVRTQFSLGEFPLQITHDRTTVDGNIFSVSSATSVTLDTSELFYAAKIDDVLKVTFIFPNVSNSWGIGAYTNFRVDLSNADGKKKVICNFDPPSGEITLVTSFDGGVSGFGEFTSLLSEAVLTPIVTGEKVVGFTLSGKLLDTISSIYLSPSFNIDKGLSTHSVSVTYSSYDDLQIEVNRVPLRNYNGVYLPELPNDPLPYVTIVHMIGTDTYRAIFSTNAMVIREVDEPQVMTWNSDDDISVYAYTQGSSDTWTIDNTDTDHVYAGDIWYYETYNAEWVWSNTDILDENGDLIYDNPDAGVTAPSKSNFDLRSWLAMYLMGRCGSRILITKDNLALAAGLYKTGTRDLIYSWDQLTGDEVLEGGVVHVNDGVLTTNVEKSTNTLLGDTWRSNTSIDVLKGDLVIPTDVGITEISKWAFYNCTYLTGITIPEGTRTLGCEAFYKCTALLRIDLPSTLTTIVNENAAVGSYGAFRGCEKLTIITLPENLTTLGTREFQGCTSLEKINIPAGISRIYNWCFYECANLKEVIFNEGLSIISTNTFEGCVNLESVDFPDSLTEIHDSAFSGCTSLRKIHIPASTEVSACNVFYKCTGIQSFELASGNPYHVVIDGNLYWNEGKKLGNYALGKTATEFVVPEGVTVIDGSAFCGCQYVEKITMPSTLTQLYGVAIAECPSLKTLVMNSESPPSTTTDSWLEGTTLTSIIVPAGCASAYKAAERWSDYANIIVEST